MVSVFHVPKADEEFKQDIYALNPYNLGLSDQKPKKEQFELTFLQFNELISKNQKEDNRLNIIKYYGTKYEKSDFVDMLADYGCLTRCWTRTICKDGVICIDFMDDPVIANIKSDFPVIRPALKVTKEFLNNNLLNRIDDGKVFFGEYPQFLVSKAMNLKLTSAYKNHLFKNRFHSTGESYNLGNGKSYKVYEFDGIKYMRYYKNNSHKSIWVEVFPIQWYVDTKTCTLLSADALLTGVPFCNFSDADDFINEGKFEKTYMYKFLNNHMLKDILQSENIDYELLKDDNSDEINEPKKSDSSIQNVGNELLLMMEIDYNLSKLKDINKELYLKYNDLYDKYKSNNISDITTLASLNAKIIAELAISKERLFDLIQYLNNIKNEYMNNFLNNNQEKTQLNLEKLDKIYKLFLNKQNDYNVQDKVEVLKDLGLIYFLEVYENKDSITLEELENSCFKYHIKTIIVWIRDLIEKDIITCSYFLSLRDEVNVKIMLDMIKSIKFKNNKVKKLGD